MRVALVHRPDGSPTLAEIGETGVTALDYDVASGNWTWLDTLPADAGGASLAPPFAPQAVIAPGPRLDGPPDWQTRHREFHVKPSSVIGAARSAAPRRPAPLACRLQAGLVFRPTPRFTAREDILDGLIGCHLVAELIDIDAFRIDWEGSRWHLRFGEGMSFDGACPTSSLMATPDEFGDQGIMVSHAQGECLLSWSAMAEFAAYVSRYLELGPRLLLLAGWPFGPVLEPAERGPSLHFDGPMPPAPSWASNSALGRVEWAATEALV